MAKKRIDVFLNDEEMVFIEWLAKRDNVTVQEELRQCFYTELMQLMDLYNEERLQGA